MTPYDTALRVQRRELDTVRLSISVEVQRISEIEIQGSALETRLKQERKLASAQSLATDAWVERMRGERARLNAEAAAAGARLSQLRAKAMEAYGSVRAIECAADRFRTEAGRAAAAAEQNFSDDIAGGRFARLLRTRARNKR